MNETIYKEVSATYRFFLGWRHAAIVGIVVIMGGVISLLSSVSKESPGLAFLVPLFASPLGVIFWAIDVRTRDLYHAAMRAGKALERGVGFFTVLSEVAVPEG
jgi:hypothetical protein